MAYNAGTDPTLTELITGKFIPEVFSKKVIDHTQSNLVVVSHCNTDWQDDLRLGYKVSIPVMSEITATEVTPGSEPTPASAVGTAESITVDKWYEATIEVSEMSDIENKVSYLDAAAKSCGYAISKKIDTDVGALFSTLAGDSVYGSDGQTLTDDIILALMEYLDEGDVPDDGNRSLISDPSSKVDLLKIDKFIRNDYVRNPVVATGKFGDIYNMGVFITNNLTSTTVGNYGVMMHKDAIGVVIQRKVRARRIPKPWEFTIKYTADAIWGEDEIRDTFGKSFYTRSS